MNKKEVFEITRNGELYGALLELDTTKFILEGHAESLTIQLKDVKKAIRVNKKLFENGSELYEKTKNKKPDFSKTK